MDQDYSLLRNTSHSSWMIDTYGPQPQGATSVSDGSHFQMTNPHPAGGQQSSTPGYSGTIPNMNQNQTTGSRPKVYERFITPVPQPSQSQPSQSCAPNHPPSVQMTDKTPTMEPSLKDWLIHNGIATHTIEQLVTNGFVSKRAFSIMEKEDISAIGIQMLGQQRLPQHLIEEAKAERTTAGPMATQKQDPRPAILQNKDPLSQLNSQIQDLLGGSPPTSTIQAATAPPLPTLAAAAAPATLLAPGERVDINPLAYIIPRQKQKFKDICDYVDFAAETAEDKVLASQEGHELILKTNKKSLDNVSPMQWSAANMHILLDLLREGQL